MESWESLRAKQVRQREAESKARQVTVKQLEKDFLAADKAVVHFIEHMRKRGYPGVQHLEAHTGKGWAARYGYSPFQLLIERGGAYWGIFHYNSGNLDCPGSWTSRVFRVGRSGGYKPHKVHPGEEEHIKIFQHCLLELMLKHSVPMPPD